MGQDQVRRETLLISQWIKLKMKREISSCTNSAHASKSQNSSFYFFFDFSNLSLFLFFSFFLFCFFKLKSVFK